MTENCDSMRMLEDIDRMANAVSVTFGPKGRNVLVENNKGAPFIMNKGALILKEITGPDSDGAAVLKLCSEAALKVQDEAGDGTTTALLLIQGIVREGVKNITAGANPVFLARSVSRAAGIAAGALREMARPVANKEELLQIASLISGDDETGALVADAVFRTGEYGAVMIEEAHGLESSMEAVEGMRIDRGYISPQMATNEASMEAVLEDAFVLLTDFSVSNPRDLLPVLEGTIQEDKCMLIIANEVESEALSVLLTNKVRGTLLTVSIRAPEFSDRRKAAIRDIAVFTGGSVISKDIGLELKDARVEHLGIAKKIIVKKDTTTIIGGGGDPVLIKKRLSELKHHIENAESGFDKSKLLDRYNKLSGMAVILRIGGATRTELHLKRARAEGALKAVKAAMSGGCVPGGGVAYLRAAEAVRKNAALLKGDDCLGALILAAALEAPVKIIAENAGLPGSVIRNKTRESQMPNWGYDVLGGKYCDMFETGIIDPLPVSLTALECAVSCAATLLTANHR